MQKIDHHSKYTVLFTYSKLSLLDRNGFYDTWQRICDTDHSLVLSSDLFF